MTELTKYTHGPMTHGQISVIYFNVDKNDEKKDVMGLKKQYFEKYKEVLVPKLREEMLI